MARTIFDGECLQRIDQRLAQLRPDLTGRWGKMTPPEMVCHLTDSLEVATGAAPARAKNTFMANPLVRGLIIHVIPWPKGKAQTVPEMLKTKPASWDADVARLRGQLQDVARRGMAAEWAPHPAFGNIKGRDYGTLIYRHFDHHLTQFGV